MALGFVKISLAVECLREFYRWYLPFEISIEILTNLTISWIRLFSRLNRPEVWKLSICLANKHIKKLTIFLYVNKSFEKNLAFAVNMFVKILSKEYFHEIYYPSFWLTFRTQIFSYINSHQRNVDTLYFKLHITQRSILLLSNSRF